MSNRAALVLAPFGVEGSEGELVRNPGILLTIFSTSDLSNYTRCFQYFIPPLLPSIRHPVSASLSV